MEGLHANQESTRSRGNRSRVSSQAQRRIEKEWKREQDVRLDRHETRLDSDEASFRGERTISYVLEPSYQSDRDHKIESLQKQIKELELKKRCRHQRRDYDRSSHNHESTSTHTGGSSYQSHSHLSRDRSNESKKDRSRTSRRERQGHPNAALDAISWALRRVGRSPFSKEIKRTKMPRHFTCPLFTCYDGKTNPLEHVSHYTQLMAFYSQNDGLICKVFPSSLKPMVMRWFNRLKKGSIHSFGKLIRVFGACFITCSRAPQPIDALLSIRMRSGETFQSYAGRYWKLYNEIRWGNEPGSSKHV